MTLDIPPAQAGKIRYDRNNTVIHSKGPAVVNALAVVLGREEFERIYRKALRDFGGKRFGWHDLQRYCEEESGQSLQWFFDQWVRSNAYLCYQVDGTDSRPTDDGYRTEVRIKRLGTMSMPVPVKAVFEDDTEQTAMSDRTQDLAVFTFESRAKLKEVLIDPDNMLAMAKEPLSKISQAAAERLAWGWSPAESLSIFEVIREEGIESSGIWYQLGRNLYERDRLDEAFVCFEKIVELESDPVTSFAAWGWLGLLSDLRGDRGEALRYYREALARDVGEAMNHGSLRIRMDRAWVEERLKTPFSPESIFTLPAQPTPDELVAIVNEMNWTREGNNPLRVFEKARPLSIPTTRFWLKLGLLLYDGKNYSESEAAFDRLLSLASTKLDQFAAWTWKGHLLDLRGRRGEAVGCYKKAFELYPGFSMSHSQYDMVLDLDWIEERLRTPFTRR
jgi:tetratricopeptide (TPR) repeat protein